MQRPWLAASCSSKRRHWGGGDGPLAERIAGFLLNGYFSYAALTVLWVWILSFIPLSRAYPFLALAEDCFPKETIERVIPRQRLFAVRRGNSRR
jgi:hypothetical protein